MTLLALTGPAGCGKSTVAKRLAETRGAIVEKFAGPLKDMFRAIGLTEDEIEGSAKELPCDLLCGETPRRAMQTLGTEWGRDMIHPELWSRAWRHRVVPGRLTIADDCRFPNEAAIVRAMGGTVVRIVRPGLCAAGHASETSMALITPDIVPRNDGTLEDLFRKADALIRLDV